MRPRYYTPADDLAQLVKPKQVYRVLGEFTATLQWADPTEPDEDFILEYGDQLIVGHLDEDDLNCYFHIGEELYWAATDDLLEFCKLL